MIRSLSLLLTLALTFSASAVFIIDNGGSILVGGVKYELADLHFVADPSERLVFDQKMRAKLRGLRDLLERRLHSPIERRPGLDFFEMEVLSPSIEFHFVERLPSNCSFLPIENLPPELRQHLLAPAGCTFGAQTFLLPAIFQKLSLDQQALLIVHERLHALAPFQRYEIKTDLIKALWILLTRYAPALHRADPEFRLHSQELRTLNLFSHRLRQLTDRTGPEHLMTEIQFTARGGLLRTDNVSGATRVEWEMSDAVVVELGSELRSTLRSFVPEDKVVHRVTGAGSRLVDTTLSIGGYITLHLEETELREVEIDFPASFPALLELKRLRLSKALPLRIPSDYRFLSIGSEAGIEWDGDGKVWNLAPHADGMRRIRDRAEFTELLR